MKKINEWRFGGFQPISGESIDSDNSGLLPLQPKFLKRYINQITGEIIYSTDLAGRQAKRNTIVWDFKKFYVPKFKRKEVSLFGIVVNDCDTISNFIHFLKKKLKRKQISVLGYLWVRDVGEEKFKKHFHLLFAIERINGETFKILFETKKTEIYDVEFIRNLKGLAKYCRNKDLYGTKSQRPYGRSKEFKIPSCYELKTH